MRVPEFNKDNRSRLLETLDEPSWLPNVCWCFVGLLFVACSWRSLAHTDLYGHLAYGRLIHETGTVPDAEPFMPLSKGISMIDTAWLSQWLGFQIWKIAGFPGIQAAYALLIATSVANLMSAVWQRTCNSAAALIGGFAFLIVGWQQLLIVRPQLVGVACYAILLNILVRWESRVLTKHQILRSRIGIFLVFVFWTNCHGSFVIGLLLLACFGFQATVRDYLNVRQQSTANAAAVPEALKALLLNFTFAGVAILLNPHGWRIIGAVTQFSANPNLANIIEWQPIGLAMKQGRIALVAAIVFAGLLIPTWKKIQFAETLLLLGFGIGMLVYSRMLNWWAPIAALSLAVHGHAFLSQPFRAPARGELVGNRPPASARTIDH